MAPHRLPNGPLALLFAGVLAFVAIRMFMQARGSDAKASAGSQHVPPCQLDVDSGRFLWTGPCARALALSGIGAGFLSGLLGVGGGFVIVPALRRATNAPMHAIVATSLTIITLISLSGVVSTALEGRMNWRVGVPFAAGGAIWHAWWSTHRPASERTPVAAGLRRVRGSHRGGHGCESRACGVGPGRPLAPTARGRYTTMPVATVGSRTARRALFARGHCVINEGGRREFRQHPES